MAMALLLLALMSVLVPLLVFYAQTESKWAVRETQFTTAFHLAEAATERGYFKLSQSTGNWMSIQAGAPLSGYNFDVKYTDIPGGEYAIYISSGSGEGTAIIIGIGRETKQNLVRTVQVDYIQNALGNVAIMGGQGVSITGNNYKVEWGAVVSQQSLTVGDRDYPQFWSGGTIDKDTTSPGSWPPNCDQPDCCQWHSFSKDVPPLPSIDLNFYKSSATASGTPSDSDCGSSYYITGNQTWSGCNDSSGKTYYITGNLTVNSTGGGNSVEGNVVVLGNLNLSNGNFGTGARTVYLPQKAWKQYCNDWAHYQAFDTGEPSSFPGLDSDYLSASTVTVSLDKIFVYGFLYVGGNLVQGGGGGSGSVVGTAFIVGTSTLNASSNVTIYYNADIQASLKTTRIILSRTSWKEILQEWPTGL